MNIPIRMKCLVDAPFVQQMPELPRGCEVTSLAMLLGHAGIQVDKMVLAEAIKKVPFYENGYHGHLNDGFVGDMYSFETDGIGTYFPPILQLGQHYLPGRMVNLCNNKIDNLLEYLRENHVPIWVVTNDTFEELSEDHFQTWNTKHGEIRITYRMHSVLIVGFDDEQNLVYIHDPLHDAPLRAMNKHSFEKAWVQMGQQGLSYRD